MSQQQSQSEYQSQNENYKTLWDQMKKFSGPTDTKKPLNKISDEMHYSTMCMESYPCQHYCNVNGVNKTMDAVQIQKYCTQNNLPIPSHFQGQSYPKWNYH